MRRRLLTAVLLAVAACRQIAGLEDRPTLEDAGASSADASPPTEDAAIAPTATFCTNTDAAFCDDFEGPDRAWEREVSDDASGPVGALFVGDGGLASARALHAVSADNDVATFRNNRLIQTLTPTTQKIELAFSVLVPRPAYRADTGGYQLALLEVLGTAFYPTLAENGLTFSWEFPGISAVEQPSRAGLSYDAWHRIVMTIDRTKLTVQATIDGEVAIAEQTFTSGNTGAYTARIGLRTNARTVPLEVRYDDVTVRFR